MRHYYGIYATIDHARCFALTTVKRHAIQVARKYAGAEVRQAPAATFDGGDCYGIDAPTFRVQSERIYPATQRGE